LNILLETCPQSQGWQLCFSPTFSIGRIPVALTVESPQLISDIEERKVIASGERRVVGYFSPMVMGIGYRLVICKMAISAPDASDSQGDQKGKGYEDLMALEI